MQDMKKSFSERLKEARGKAGLTQIELAEKVGSKQNTISMYEKGTQTPSLQLAYQIADELNVSLDWLCGFNPDSSNISCYQWLIYLDDLLNNPPEIQGEKTISLDDSFNNAVAIILTGEEMAEFFQKYKGIQTIRAMDIDLYKAARKKLFEKYGKLFEQGFKKTAMGIPVINPPIA